MKVTRKRLVAALAAVFVVIVVGWQVVTYNRSVHDDAIGFADFLAIRVIVTTKGIDFDWSVHQFHPHDFTIHLITKTADGLVEVSMGVQTAPLAGGGLLYKMKRSGWWWSVVSNGCWQS